MFSPRPAPFPIANSALPFHARSSNHIIFQPQPSRVAMRKPCLACLNARGLARGLAGFPSPPRGLEPLFLFYFSNFLPESSLRSLLKSYMRIIILPAVYKPNGGD